MYKVVKSVKMCSVPRIKAINCSCVQNKNTEQKEIFQLVDPKTKQWKQYFEF